MFDSLPTWGPEFEMQVEIKINSWIDSWGSIFTFKAIDGNVGEIGQRIPGIWTKAGTNDSLYLSTHINDNGNYFQLSEEIGKFETNFWYTFFISQKKDEVLIDLSLQICHELLHHFRTMNIILKLIFLEKKRFIKR